PFPLRTSLEPGEERNRQSMACTNFYADSKADAAPCKEHSSFPQSIPFVWKLDASIANKTQYIVVFC
ncbi:MAG TPA: hypothetical protein VGF01_12575, partial [Terracidiphilus sp.]